jgi:tetratricopeptide (TPR) repeat protein
MRCHSPGRTPAAIAALGVWLLALGYARAEDDAGDPAQALFTAARASFDAGRYAEALESFQTARRLTSRPSLALWMGNCYRRLHRPREALRYYHDYVLACDAERLVPPSAPGEQRLHACSQEVQAEVRELVKDQQEVVDLVQSGEALLQTNQPLGALVRFRQAEQRSPWVVIGEQIGRAQMRLGHPDEARASWSKALAGLERYLDQWKARHPERDPPEADQIRRDRSRIEALLREPLPQPSAPAQAPEPPAPQFSKGWLASGVVTTGATVTLGILAGVAFYRAHGWCPEIDPCFSYYRTAYGVTLGFAITSAVASGASWYLFHRSRRPRPVTRRGKESWRPTVEVTRTADRWLIGGGGQF